MTYSPERIEEYKREFGIEEREITANVHTEIDFCVVVKCSVCDCRLGIKHIEGDNNFVIFVEPHNCKT